MLHAIVLSLCVATALGHGAVVSPRTRNSIDYLVNVSTQICANVTGDACNNGQASFWYSQGCFIGCETCDHTSGRRQTDLCQRGMNATINDPKFRSVNRAAVAGSPADIYKHNPWRAPGSAPVASACGLAGGSPYAQNGAEAGDYVKTVYAHHGMDGLTLPPMDTGVVWKIGGEAEVTWQVRNNHGGGYQYRLCPAEEPLSEDCFQKFPLEFDQTKSAIVFSNGTRLPIKGTFVSEGTLPKGSTWAMIPIPPTWLGPRCIGGTPGAKNECLPGEDALKDGPCVPCPQTPGSDCSRCDNNKNPAFPPPCGNGECEGNEVGAAALDVVKIPSGLKPGKYVLGWRYDCEATAQVWSNCADITLA